MTKILKWIYSPFDLNLISVRTHISVTMQQKILRAACVAAMFLFLHHNPAVAQSETPKFEVGTQFSVIRFSDLEITEPGFGGRFTYNVNDHLAVEAEVNFFPREVKDSFGETLQGGRKTQGLFGVQTITHRKRVPCLHRSKASRAKSGHYG